ncbi:arginine-glutamic acid dipeptide repeat protein [Trifolium repens]|nr:arginine-glutamic acid dipeptide repeat protein [Trifolium repens]
MTSMNTSEASKEESDKGGEEEPYEEYEENCQQRFMLVIQFTKQKLSPRPPLFTTLKSGAFEVCREGCVLLQFAPATVAYQYDWNRKQMVSYEENDNESEQFSLRMNRADSEAVHDKSLSFAIGLPIPVTWIRNETEDSRHEELGYHRDIDSYQLAPGRSSSSWSDADTKSFLLGLFIFGKNFIQIKRFLDNKGMGEILSLYYGKFYKTDGYRRWSECRKKKGRKCMIGQKLFTGPRQHELLSCLIPYVSKESQDNLLQVSKSYLDGKTSLEKYISSLKSIVGLGVLVEAVGIGKEEGDLTRGWHSEQPKYRGYVTSKDYLVFLIPGVEKFSRRKLVKSDHYFDSVSDVLRKVVAEPSILELEEEAAAAAAKVGNFNEEEPEKGSNEDDLSDDQRQCYLKPRPFTYNKDHIKFMVIDTSLVHSRKPSDLRKLKSLPVNSVGKVEVDVAGKKYKGQKYTRKVNCSKDISKSNIQNSTKLKVTDTNSLSKGKILKLKVKQLKYLPVELDDASTMTTDLLKQSKAGCSTDDSPKMVEAKMLMFGKMATIKKEAYENPDNDANQMIENQKNKRTYAFDDDRLKRITNNQSNGRVRSGDSDLVVVPKRRKLTAFSHQQHGSSTSSSADRSVEEDNENSICNDSDQCTSFSCVNVKKCESITFSIPQVPSKSQNSKTMTIAKECEQGLKVTSATYEVVEEPPRIFCPRRQSSRNRPLTVRALECIANEFLHVQRRQKRKDIETHNKDRFNPCHHGTAVLVQKEKPLNGDSSIS